MARPKRDELALLAAADLIEAAREADDQELAWTTPLLAQTCLPVRNPGNIPVYERRNGDTLLTIRPGYVDDPKTGKSKSLGYPSGVLARKSMIWIIGEARRTKSRELVMGDGITDFLRTLQPGSAASAGPTGSLTRLRVQTEQLFNAAITVRIDRPGPDGEPATIIKNLTVANQAVLWGKDSKGTSRAVVQLSGDFYDEILQRALPLDWNALHVFGDDATAIDLYIFLTYTMATLKRRITISLDDLNERLGLMRKLETKEARYKARKAYEKKLARVLSVYRDANVELTTAGLVLTPSRPHVLPKGWRAVESSLIVPPSIGA
ncbi:replication protein RepA [Nocardia sp. XZ_19_369]|uniref:replication protein RepA n=1 Tax=Nocardia sp. XZ_19_369 TaxID=2769487 RepID=UPI00188FAEA6|nr:replication protein RepA [Nocardia sp. XZ_19_369]